MMSSSWPTSLISGSPSGSGTPLGRTTSPPRASRLRTRNESGPRNRCSGKPLRSTVRTRQNCRNRTCAATSLRDPIVVILDDTLSRTDHFLGRVWQVSSSHRAVHPVALGVHLVCVFLQIRQTAGLVTLPVLEECHRTTWHSH